MLQLSQKSKYALSLLAFLGQQDTGTYLSIRTISSLMHLPYRFLSQIAVDLKHAGLIDAKEGKGGGYFLNKTLDSVSLKNMIEAVDGQVGLVDCQRGCSCGCEMKCENKHKWDRIQDEVSGVLGKYKISDIL